MKRTAVFLLWLGALGSAACGCDGETSDAGGDAGDEEQPVAGGELASGGTSHGAGFGDSGGRSGAGPGRGGPGASGGSTSSGGVIAGEAGATGAGRGGADAGGYGGSDTCPGGIAGIGEASMGGAGTGTTGGTHPAGTGGTGATHAGGASPGGIGGTHTGGVGAVGTGGTGGTQTGGADTVGIGGTQTGGAGTVGTGGTGGTHTDGAGGTGGTDTGGAGPDGMGGTQTGGAGSIGTGGTAGTQTGGAGSIGTGGTAGTHTGGAGPDGTGGTQTGGAGTVGTGGTQTGGAGSIGTGGTGATQTGGAGSIGTGGTGATQTGGAGSGGVGESGAGGELEGGSGGISVGGAAGSGMGGETAGTAGQASSDCADYQGDPAWQLELEVTPDGTEYCGAFSESRSLEEEYAAKAKLILPAGTYRLPDASGTNPFALPVCFERPSGVVDPRSAGAGSVVTTRSTFFSTDLYDHEFAQPLVSTRPGEWSFRGRVEYSSDAGVMPEPFVLDGGGLDVMGGFLFQLCEGDACYDVDDIVFDSCYPTTYVSHPETITFDGGQLALNTLIGPDSTPAMFVSASGTLYGRAFAQTDYWKLVYAAGHHNFDQNYAVLFDAPIGGACGLKVLAPASGELPGLYTIECDLSNIDQLTVIDVVYE